MCTVVHNNPWCAGILQRPLPLSRPAPVLPAMALLPGTGRWPTLEGLGCWVSVGTACSVHRSGRRPTLRVGTVPVPGLGCIRAPSRLAEGRGDLSPSARPHPEPRCPHLSCMFSRSSHPRCRPPPHHSPHVRELERTAEHYLRGSFCPSRSVANTTTITTTTTSRYCFLVHPHSPDPAAPTPAAPT